MAMTKASWKDAGYNDAREGKPRKLMIGGTWQAEAYDEGYNKAVRAQCGFSEEKTVPKKLLSETFVNLFRNMQRRVYRDEYRKAETRTARIQHRALMSSL